MLINYINNTVLYIQKDEILPFAAV